MPPDSDRRKDTFISKLYALFNHKMAATSAGIGWVGKNGLLISPEHGPRLSLATVLTDAPLAPDAPVEAGRCGECTLCRDHCPSGAITGAEWSRRDPFVELVRLGALPGAQGRRAADRRQAQLRALHHGLPLRAHEHRTSGQRRGGAERRISGSAKR